MLGGPDANSFNSANIYNIYGSAAPEFITQDGPYLHQQGSHDELWIESFSLSNVIGHGARQMTDSLAVEDLLMRVSSNNVDMQDDCQRPGVNRMAG